jgi:hypothetical protein
MALLETQGLSCAIQEPLPGLLEDLPKATFKTELAWRASAHCAQTIVGLLENNAPLSIIELELIIEAARGAEIANNRVAKRDRACRKCIVGYLGYCPFASGFVGKDLPDGQRVTLTPRMGSDLIGTNLHPEEGSSIPVERAPLDGFLDIGASDIMDSFAVTLSTGRKNGKGKCLTGLKDELAKKHFEEWEQGILKGKDTVTLASTEQADVNELVAV